MNIGWLFVGGAVLLVVVAGLFTVRLKPQRARFEKNGIPADAEITSLRRSRVPGFVFSSRGWFVDYTYFSDVPGQGKVRQGGHHQIAEGTSNTLQVGGPLHILYLPDHPEVSRPSGIYLDPDIERKNALSCLTYAGSVAVGILIVAFILLSRQPTTNTIAAQASAEQQKELTEIHTALDSKISAWQTSATAHQIRLSAADAGFASDSQMREVYYGTCKSNGANHFYVYVMRFISPGQTAADNWLGMAYAFTPGVSKIADCLPEGWSILSDATIDGDWHSATFVYPPQIPFFKLTATASH